MKNHNFVNITVKLFRQESSRDAKSRGGEGFTRNRTSINLKVSPHKLSTNCKS